MSKNVFVIAEQRDGKIMKVSYESVSYTHLTLPTN